MVTFKVTREQIQGNFYINTYRGDRNEKGENTKRKGKEKNN